MAKENNNTIAENLITNTYTLIHYNKELVLNKHEIQIIRDYINNITNGSNVNTQLNPYYIVYNVAIINKYNKETIIKHEDLRKLFTDNIESTYYLFTYWVKEFPKDGEIIADLISSNIMRDNCGQASEYVHNKLPYYDKIIKSVIINNCVNNFGAATYRMDKEFTQEKFYRMYCANTPEAQIGIII